MGRRDAGPHLQPEDEEGRRHQRPRGRADRRHAGLLSPEGHAVSAGVRPARRRHPGHARRTDGHAGRVRHAQPRGRARARDRNGRRLPDRSAGRRSHRTSEGRNQEMVVLEGRVPAPRGSGARSAARRRDFQAGGSRGDAAQARRAPNARRSSQARAARKRSRPRTTASTGETSRRSSSAVRASSVVSTRPRTSTSGRCTSKSR